MSQRVDYRMLHQWCWIHIEEIMFYLCVIGFFVKLGVFISTPALDFLLHWISKSYAPFCNCYQHPHYREDVNTWFWTNDRNHDCNTYPPLHFLRVVRELMNFSSFFLYWSFIEPLFLWIFILIVVFAECRGIRGFWSNWCEWMRDMEFMGEGTVALALVELRHFGGADLNKRDSKWYC